MGGVEAEGLEGKQSQDGGLKKADWSSVGCPHKPPDTMLSTCLLS